MVSCVLIITSFFTTLLNLSSISFDISIHLLFFFLISVILYFTQNSLGLFYVTCVCYLTIHTIKLRRKLWRILMRVRKLSKYFDILLTVSVGYITLRQVCSHLNFVCACVSGCVCVCFSGVNSAYDNTKVNCRR